MTPVGDIILMVLRKILTIQHTCNIKYRYVKIFKSSCFTFRIVKEKLKK